MAAHLVFIPSPGAGHIFAAAELAKLLVERDHRLTVSILLITFPDGVKTTSLLSSSRDRITYVRLSPEGYVPDPTKPWMHLPGFLIHHKPQVRDFLAKSTRLAGVVIDMFCMEIGDVADEFGVPSYVLSTCGAAFMCLAFHGLDRDLSQFKDSDTELVVPGFVNSVPAKVLPPEFRGDHWSKMFQSWTAKCKDTKGILVNTFFELESHAITYLSENDTIPPIYPVGPVINLEGASDNIAAAKSDNIIRWLDDQPKSSVMFLCFGSKGCFDAEQVAEIARALENSRARFLWSLRRPLPKFPQDYEDVAEALPKGFLERTAGIGKVIGWAPQTAVLSHPAVGGFITHCGWNSSLESIWFGVPMATWPLDAEQQINAFELVKELGIAVELKLDYKKNYGAKANYLITAEEIEKALKQLMEVSVTDDNLIQQKVKDMSEKSRMAIANGGSSYAYMDRFIQDVISNSNSKN